MNETIAANATTHTAAGSVVGVPGGAVGGAVAGALDGDAADTVGASG
jgi:hypothetical protein